MKRCRSSIASGELPRDARTRGWAAPIVLSSNHWVAPFPLGGPFLPLSSPFLLADEEEKEAGETQTEEGPAESG